VVGFEDVGEAFFEDHRGEGAEPLTVLDAGVEDVLHPGKTGVSEDRSVAERPRAPFHAALEPADDFALDEEFGGAAEEFGFGERFKRDAG
jgi:hypothetical protein